LGTKEDGEIKAMKVLYLGHYKEGTGWANAAINNILALNKQDIDLVTRNVRLTKETNVPEEILELEKKDLQNVDVCIQHVLPHHLVASTKFKKNIAYTYNETDTLKFASNWIPCLQMMDEVWVPCDTSSSYLKNDGVNNVKVVPCTFNTNDYISKDEVFADGLVRDNFKFYYIGDINDRKNIDNIIRCFHVAFSPSDPVDLILKVNSPAGEIQTQDIINTKSESVKKSLRLYSDISKYKNEFIISRNLSRQEILNLHQICDCYIAPSHGEAWNIPAFEAMAFGNTPICSNEGGPKDFIDKENKNTGTLVTGIQKICNHQNTAFPFIGTGREMWFEPDDKEIMDAMKFYFENRNTTNKTEGMKRAEMFSYENVGKKMLEYLNE
jgi:glycosyltransferase involved in cell wall biosynthesis